MEGTRMSPDLIGYGVAAGFAVAVAAFFVGRVTSAGAKRRRELEEQLANAHDELAGLAAELENSVDQLRTAREEHETYRLSVVDHFSGTSDLLRDLTVQYRSVYEHLTKGASTLCPEGFVGLTEGLPAPQIAEPSEPTAQLERDDDDEAGVIERNDFSAESGDSDEIPPPPSA
jgi:uncharacterized membrane-anchored protein YhcB (DUF1043 family)